MSARITQTPELVAILPTTQKARITQVVELAAAEGWTPPPGNNFAFFGTAAVAQVSGNNAGKFGD